MSTAGDILGDLLSTPLHDEQDGPEEFVNRNHTPTSAHPNLVAMPPIGQVKPWGTTSPIEIHWASSVFNTKLSNGVRAEVDDASYDGKGNLMVHGSLYDYRTAVDNGGEPIEAGTFDRMIEPGGVVHHELLHILPSYQGQGMATEFNAHAEDMYRAYGFREIHLEAASTVGGYAWAVAGYDWDGPFPPHIRVQIRDLANSKEFDTNSHGITQLAGHPKADAMLTPEVRKEFKALSDRIDAGDRVAPFEVAQVGSHTQVEDGWGDTKRQLWAGKALLLGNTWYAVKRLDALPKVSVNTPTAQQSDRARLMAIMTGSQ